MATRTESESARGRELYESDWLDLMCLGLFDPTIYDYLTLEAFLLIHSIISALPAIYASLTNLSYGKLRAFEGE